MEIIYPEKKIEYVRDKISEQKVLSCLKNLKNLIENTSNDKKGIKEKIAVEVEPSKFFGEQFYAYLYRVKRFLYFFSYKERIFELIVFPKSVCWITDISEKDCKKYEEGLEWLEKALRSEDIMGPYRFKVHIKRSEA